MVEHASNVARYLGVSDWVIAVTIVAAGTSAPEFATSVAAALTVESVATGIKSVVPNFAKSDVDILYIYFKTYPPDSTGELDSDVGSEPEKALPPLLSRTL